MSNWLDGQLSDQQRADLFVADLVRTARAYVAGKQRGGRKVAGTMLSGTLAEDWEKQEKWLQREAQARGYKDIDTLAEENYPLFEKLAELWRQKNPADNGVLLSRQFMPLVSAKSSLERAIAQATQDLWDSLSSKGERMVDLGRTPHVLAMLQPSIRVTDLLFDASIQFKAFKKSEKDGGHAGAMDAVEPADLIRGIYRPAMVFDAGNGEYVFVTNTLTDQGPVIVPIKINAKDASGNTVAKVMSAYPRERARVADWINGKVDGYKLVYADKILSQEAVTGRPHPENKNPANGGVSVGGKVSFNVPRPSASTTPDSLPNSNTNIVTKYGSPVNENYAGWASVAAALQAKWDGAKIKGAIQPRLKDYGSLLAWIDKNFKGDPADKPMFSRATPPIPVDQRAEKIIQTSAATAKPVDALVRKLTQLTRIERLTSAIYGRAGYFLNRYTPETVKAGVVSDYGVPEAVIDQRAMMQGRQRVQLRKAGSLIEKLSTLTRAESRVAYEWMNETDPHTIYTMMQNLPDESVKVLMEVQSMIDNLSKEAVRMGQLSAEAYERNKFAYLRRSYAKYTLGLTESETKGNFATSSCRTQPYSVGADSDALRIRVSSGSSSRHNMFPSESTSRCPS